MDDFWQSSFVSEPNAYTFYVNYGFNILAAGSSPAYIYKNRI